MAGTMNAGRLVYEVDMDTRRLLDAQREIDATLNRLSGSMGRFDASITRTERSVNTMQGALSSLSGVARGVMAALSVQQVAAYGNEWVTVNNKLANSIRANETLADVTQRVFDISQNTMSSLQATATLYGRLERATRSAGTSTQDLVTLTSTINKGLAVSGATTEEASSTMTQLSQALASGVLRGEEFNSISENGSRLAVALADSLGVTIGQLRAMAAEGKLTTEVVVNGLLKQSDAIAKEFGNSAQTMGQAFTVATNNITKFVGESTTVSSGIKTFNSVIVTLSQNLDVLGSAIGIAAVIFGSRFVGALALATKARLDDSLAAKAQARATAETAAATANAARVSAIKAGLDKEQALSNLALAQAEYNVARGTAAEAFALDNLIAKKSIAIQMSATHAETQLAEAAATRTATAAAAAATTTIGGLARNALALIGGPAGFAMIAAAGLFYFYQKAQQAKQESIDFASTLDTVISKMKEMSQVQLKGELSKTAKSVDALKESLSDQIKEQDKARNSVSEFQKQLDGLRESGAPIEVINEAQKRLTASMGNLNEAASDVDSTSKLLSSTLQKQSQIQEELNQKARDSEAAFNVLASSLREKIPKASSAAIAAMVSTMQVLDEMNAKVSGGVKPKEPELSSKAQDLIRNAERRLALSKLEGEARARLQAQYDAEDAGLTDEKEVKRLQDKYAATQKNTAATKAGNAEAKKSASQTESITQKLEALRQKSEVTATSAGELSREMAILTAQQSLGKGATTEQIRLAGEYGAKIWDNANALKAQAAAEKLKAETEQAGRFSDQQKAAADVAVNPYSGEATNLAAQVELEQKQKLAAVAKYEAIGAMTEQEAQDTRTAIVKQASYDRMQIVKDEAQMQVDSMNTMLGGFQAGFEGLANIIGKGAGESSSAYKALFAVSKGFAIAQAGLNLQLAISNAMASGPFPWNLANMAQVAAAGGQVVSAIGGASYGGAREHGGPVQANSMYRVGEGGKPEIFKASNGSQYMIPGDSGSVISNKDLGSAGGSGGVSMEVNFHITTTNGIDEATQKQMAQQMEVVALKVAREQSHRPGGFLEKRKTR